MPTDTEIWERACERVGIWKRDQRCTASPCLVKYGDPSGWEWNDFDNTHYHRDHNIPAPAIDDAAAIVAMLEWLAPHYATVKFISLNNWQVNSGDWSPSLPLAIAAAALAVKES